MEGSPTVFTLLLLLSLIAATMNDNQNGFVTRSTSRVLSAPGGKSSTGFLFGGGGGRGKENNKASLPAKEAKEEKREKQGGASAPAEVEAAVAPEQPEVEAPAAEAAAAPENPAILAAAQIKARNEASSVSHLFGRKKSASTGQQPKRVVSSNAYASSNTTNSYNVITDRSTSRVVSARCDM